ncbi:hypothetical protein Tco_1196504, partial [Tanacetum coccineum]
MASVAAASLAHELKLKKCSEEADLSKDTSGLESSPVLWRT